MRNVALQIQFDEIIVLLSPPPVTRHPPPVTCQQPPVTSHTELLVVVTPVIHVIQKTESHVKNPVHSLFLTRFSRNDLLSTESDNIPSLQSLLRSKLTSFPQTSTVFGKSSDGKHLFKDNRFSYLVYQNIVYRKSRMPRLE